MYVHILRMRITTTMTDAYNDDGEEGYNDDDFMKMKLSCYDDNVNNDNDYARLKDNDVFLRTTIILDIRILRF